MPVNPADIYGINPWIAPPSGPGQTTQGFNAFNNYEPTTPYYNPFQVGPEQGGSISEIIAPATDCEDGYVLDSETETCVPIEVAIEAVVNGDREKENFGAIPNKGGDGSIFGYTSFADFFDGGGAGRAGSQFRGGFGLTGLAGAAANALGIRPHGYQDRKDSLVASLNAQGVPVTNNTSLDALQDIQAYHDSDDGPGGNIAAQIAAEQDFLEQEQASTSVDYDAFGDPIVRRDRDDGPSAAQQAAAAARSYSGPGTGATNTSTGQTNRAWGGRKDGGLITMNRGGSVMNPMIAYRNVGGPATLPGAVPPNQPQQPPMQGMPPEAPMAPPMAPPAPPPAPLTFAQKVEEARMMIKAGRTSVPSSPALTPQVDGQNDGPVVLPPEAGMLTEQPVGPDMGIDTVDSMLEEGSMVLNPEASSMYAQEVTAMLNGGKV